MEWEGKKKKKSEERKNEWMKKFKIREKMKNEEKKMNE